jgi:hypothetical protein
VTVGPRTAKPYGVCDSCGALSVTWAKQPPDTACKICGSTALWAFPTKDAAVRQSRLVRGRR